MADINGKKTGGRKKGVQNKDTKELRDAFKQLVENNTEHFQDWINTVAETNPAKAFELISNMAEYVLPKLSRTELAGELKVETEVNTSKYTDEELKQISEIRKKND